MRMGSEKAFKKAKEEFIKIGFSNVEKVIGVNGDIWISIKLINSASCSVEYNVTKAVERFKNFGSWFEVIQRNAIRNYRKTIRELNSKVF